MPAVNVNAWYWFYIQVEYLRLQKKMALKRETYVRRQQRVDW
jgi:hypothetical protein